ncbi:stressosome-associated protein Prli42 [Paenibacillus sp. GCM10027627]
MQQQKAIRIIAIVVAAAVLITTVLAGVGSLFLS